MKNIIFFIIPLFLVCFFGCSFSNAKDEYEQLISKSANLESEYLFSLVYNFELKNPNHFKSKIHLAQFYLLNKNYVSSLNYLDRAEKCFYQDKKNYSEEDFFQLYSLLAQVHYNLSNFEKAGECAEKISITKGFNNSTWGYFSATSFYLAGNEEKAYEIFFNNYKLIPELATPENLKLYLILLVNKNNIEEGKIILQKYFDLGGNWFLGLGKISFKIFQAKEYDSKLLLLLDYEFIKSYLEEETAMSYLISDFVNEISGLEINLSNINSKEKFMEFIAQESNEIDNPNNNFYKTYWNVKYNLKFNSVQEKYLDELLKNESIFSNLPSYYWMIWETAKKLYSFDFQKEEITEITVFIPVLKKIIALNPNGLYANLARKELSRFLEINDDSNYCQRLDLIMF